MKLIDLYQRVVETTGLDVMTIGSLKASILNCMADLTSRGYKTFVELNKESFEELGFKQNKNLIEVSLPDDIRKVLYLRLFFKNGAVVAQRYSLSNKRVACKYKDGAFRSMFEMGTAIYHIKGDKMIIEWTETMGELEELAFGYYQKLQLTGNFPEEYTEDKMKDYEIPIRKEFEDAIVFYSAYFYYARFQKDSDKINHYLSQYKYYVEDITHELAYEDEYNEEDAVIKLEED